MKSNADAAAHLDIHEQALGGEHGVGTQAGQGVLCQLQPPTARAHNTLNCNLKANS